MDNVTKGLLSVLAENGRINEIEKVVETFSTLMMAQRGIVKATITSPMKLSDSAVEKIKTSITNSYLEDNKTLIVENVVDQGILGGLQIKIGENKFIDASVQSEINKISQSLAGSN